MNQSLFAHGFLWEVLVKHSADEIIENYTGKKGIVELVFLYSNKPIDSSAHGMVKTVELLKKHNIELRLITDDAILDRVRSKYPYLGFYYFGNHTLNPKWFSDHTSHMFDLLGERYDRRFNIDTDFSYELSLFLRDQTAVDGINRKKAELLQDVETFYLRYRQHRDYLRALREAVETLPDVSIETLFDSFEWFDNVTSVIKHYVERFSVKLGEIKGERDKAITFFPTIHNPRSVEKRQNASIVN